MRIIRAASLVPQPWRNGLGTMCPIHDAANWQVSVAELGREAAFSPFEGKDRVFTLIEGEGAVLDLAGLGSLSCRPLVPTLFPGDVPTRYRPAAGPARAFNVIVSRGLVEPQVRVCSLAPGHQVSAGQSVVFCVEGRVAIGAEILSAGDTALNSGSCPGEAVGPAVVILVALRSMDGLMMPVL